MPPINIFLDTTEFDRNSFDFESRTFTVLAEKAKKRIVQVFITKIVDGEVRRHIRAKAQELANDARTFLGKRSLRGLNYLSGSLEKEFKKLNVDEIEKNRIHAYENYLASAKVSILPISEVSVDRLFKDYFSNVAPFDAKETSTQRKSEFPDAVSLAAVDLFCRKKSALMHVVSGDDDVKRYCTRRKQLKHVPSLGTALDLVAKVEDEETRNIAQFISENRDSLLEDIEKNLPEIEYEVWEDNVDLEDIYLKDIKLHRWNILLLENKVLTLEVKARAYFSATLIRSDLETEVRKALDASWEADEEAPEPIDIEVDTLVEGTLDYFIAESPPVLWFDVQTGNVRLNLETVYIDPADYT